jgi:outer membrane protein
MKYISTILSVLALALIGVLFFQLAHHSDQMKKIADVEKKASGNGFKIAYFDMDTLEAHYDYFRDAQATVKSKEGAMNMELSSLDRNNQKKVEAWRQKGNAMTPAESEQAQQEYQAMQQTFQSRKSALEQELYKNTEDLKTNIRRKIEDFVKDYNKQKGYSFIFAYDPSSFIYYKDTLYNITPDLLDGLNAAYKKKN